MSPASSGRKQQDKDRTSRNCPADSPGVPTLVATPRFLSKALATAVETTLVETIAKPPPATTLKPIMTTQAYSASPRIAIPAPISPSPMRRTDRVGPAFGPPME